MELFVDSSALAKFYYPEPESEDVEALQLAAAMTRRGALFLSADRRLAKIAALVGLGIPP